MKEIEDIEKQIIKLSSQLNDIRVTSNSSVCHEIIACCNRATSVLQEIKQMCRRQLELDEMFSGVV